jgi:hypothetical protein
MYMSNQTPDDTELPDLEMVEEAESIDDLLEAGGSISIDPNTGEMLESEERNPQIDTIPFNANIAEILTEEELDDIGDDIVEKVTADKESRKKWYDTMKKGMERLGIYCPDDDSDTGISRVSHPLLVEAATQFQARAMAELLPPGGPVKTQIIGEKTDDVLAQAQRIEDHMNYQLTIEDRGYYEERDQMLYLLPFTGSEFDKQYEDPTTGKVVSQWVRSDHFIVPYDAKSLAKAQRYTHEIHLTHNEYRRAVAAGFYTDVLMEGEDYDDAEGMEDGEPASMTEVLTTLDGQEKPATRMDSDKEHVLYETHIDYDLEGFEEDIALPFIITVCSKSKKVIGIRRNWKELDETKTRRQWFTHKKFLPGFGFYGFGLLHTIGNLGEAATEILRILLDSGAFATLQGGFKSKDAKLPGDVVLEPGVWQDCEMTAEELGRAFYTPPFKEPSQVLNALLGTIVELGQRFAATTETMVGDAATTGPVGTMVAQIEQGSKVFSGIHKRLHYAFGTEFMHIAELNGEVLPEMYPYIPSDGMRHVLKSDYDGRVDVVPVSDPNIFSSAQRIAMAQSALQLAQAMPDLADRREAAVGLLKAMRFPNPEQVFPKKAEAKRLDPLSEAASLLLGRPIKAFIEQDHKAHNMTHQGQMQSMPQQFQGLMQAHMMEHEAMFQYQQMQQRLMQAYQQQMQQAQQAMQQWQQQAQQAAMQGLPPPPQPQIPQMPPPPQMPAPDWGNSVKPTDDVFQTLSPEQENQIAQASAQAMQQMLQQQAAQQQAQQQAQQPQQKPQADPAAEEARKQAAFEADEKRKQAAFELEQQRKNKGLAEEVDREDAVAGIEPTLVKQAGEFLNQAGIQMSPRELAVLSKALGKPFSDTVAAIARMAMAGQGGSQFQQTADFHQGVPRFR